MALGQATPDAVEAIEAADEVLYLVPDPLTARWIERLNARSRSLHDLYAAGKPRQETYAEMVAEILAPARAGRVVCAAFYGHPGMFVHPGHEAIRLARAEGVAARMLPGVSALDCLAADLGIDFGATGLQSYEATDFVVYGRRPDTAAMLVLWQIGAVGDRSSSSGPSPDRLAALTERLERWYRPEHEVVVYEASAYPLVADPVVLRVPLRALPETPVPLLSTLVVPPARKPRRSRAALARLRLD